MALNMSGKKAKKDEIKYEVREHCGIIGQRGDNSTLELRYVSWNGRDPRYDIRPWYIDEENGEERCLKGITLTGEELLELGNIIKQLQEE